LSARKFETPDPFATNSSPLSQMLCAMREVALSKRLPCRIDAWFSFPGNVAQCPQHLWITIEGIGKVLCQDYDFLSDSGGEGWLKS
jgi:hypothetical protein